MQINAAIDVLSPIVKFLIFFISPANRLRIFSRSLRSPYLFIGVNDNGFYDVTISRLIRFLYIHIHVFINGILRI